MSGDRREGRGHDTLVTQVRPPRDENADAVLRMHTKIATGLLRDGAPSRAFAEMVRASRAMPMTPGLAARLVWFSLRAGAEAAALTLLKAGVMEAEGVAQAGVRRQRARLWRRMGELDRAREELAAVLAQWPDDRQALVAFQSLLQRSERWTELDASLEVEIKDAVRRKVPRRAARAALRRARLAEERLASPDRAALRYVEAAQLWENAGEWDSALNLRFLALRVRRGSGVLAEALRPEVDAFMAVARRAGKEKWGRERAAELGVPYEITGLNKPPSRKTTQLALVAAADEAQADGRMAEAAALFSAASKEGPDPTAAQRLEAHYVARGAWRELAQVYRDVANRSQGRAQVDALFKLAELLEDELHDRRLAAEVYGEIVGLGERRALAEQVRLLAAQDDMSGVRRALDEAVDGAKTPEARGVALVARADAAAARHDLKTAQRDFDEALALAPHNPAALAGKLELAGGAADGRLVLSLRDALARLQRRHPQRADLYRRLARIAESGARDSMLARAAWYEVLAEQPEDEEAYARLLAFARANQDARQLEALLRGRLKRESRGREARKARLELVRVLESVGRGEEALVELRFAARSEPGHQEAWLLLAERSTERGFHEEAIEALEQVATGTEDGQARRRVWERLATYCREVVKDAARAKTYQERADQLSEEGPTELLVDLALGGLPGEHEDVMEMTTGDLLLSEEDASSLEWEAPPGPDDEVSAEDETPVPREVETSRLIRAELMARVRKTPLEPAAYRELAAHFERMHDPPRGDLMGEIADALEGVDRPEVAAPGLMLSATDRAGLRHPLLRNDAGELLSLAGVALCRLFPAKGKDAGAREEFRLEAGPGAASLAEALVAAVRILGLRAAEVHPSEEAGPPFSLVYINAPRLLTGRLAIRKPLPEPELRFFAGRALFTQTPDLMCLRTVSVEGLQRGLHLLWSVLRGGRELTAEGRAMSGALSRKSLPRLAELASKVGRELPLAPLLEGARHSVNRAGLVVAGGVGPALEALRAKRALRSELIELVRFASSERYLQLRNRQRRSPP